MKYLILFGVLFSFSIVTSFGQIHTSDNQKVVGPKNLKKKNSEIELNPSIDKNAVGDPLKSNSNGSETKSQTQLESNGDRYLEYKADPEGDLLNSIATMKNQSDDQKVFSPILAEGYTDPNYELNKKKSEDIIIQLQAPSIPQKSNEELILDLQAKIKAIKDGVVVDAIAIKKLPLYEEELQLLLNNK